MQATQQNNYNNKPRIQDDVVQYANGILYEPTFVVTQADVHSEQSPVKQTTSDPLPPYPENGNSAHSRQPSEEFPPPPYPIIAPTVHSRQGSEEFPPPPPPIEDNNQSQINNKNINSQQSSQPKTQQQIESQQITSLLAQLKLKRESEIAEKQNETWLKELQDKQAERKTMKEEPINQDIPKVRPSSLSQIPTSNVVRRTSDLMMNTIMNNDVGRDVPDCPRTVMSSVKNMAAKFEQKMDDIKPLGNIYAHSPTTVMQDCQNSEELKTIKSPTDNLAMMNKPEKEFCDYPVNSSVESTMSQNNFMQQPPPSTNMPNGPESGFNAAIMSMSLTLPHENGLPIDCPEDDISEVAMQNTIQNTTILPIEDDMVPRKTKKRIGKKKSVSFCDQVVLVATAEDDEKDSYIPNPILERVLRSAMNKPETAQVLREIRSLQEAELNRDTAVPTKFQQHTLPLKSEADSIPSTPFLDQLRSVVPAADATKQAMTRQNPNDPMMIRESYSGYPENSARTTPTPMSSLQQQIRYTQNGYPQSQQQMISNQNIYPQVQTSHPRNQNIPISQAQKPASPYTVQAQNQYIQNGLQQKNNVQKNMHGPYYHLEQQNNQMNRQLSTQQQQHQNIINQRLQGQTASPITVQQQQNLLNQRLHSQNSSPITVQQQQQQFNLPNGQSSSSYPQYPPQNSQYSQNSYQSHPYQSVPQPRLNQSLPQYQPPPNPVGNYQHPSAQQMQQQQQNLQNGTAVAYQQRLENYQRQQQTQKMDQQQIMHSQNQGHINGQIPPNLKYPPYQQLQKTKQMEATHQQQMPQQMQMMQGNMKGSPVINQNMSAMQKSSVSTAPKVAPCNLCRLKEVTRPELYCPNCAFYMARYGSPLQTTDTH